MMIKQNPRQDKNKKQPGAVHLLGQIRHLARQPGQRSLCCWTGKQVSCCSDCSLILYVLQLFFILVLCSASQVVTSLAAMALPNWRHLELGLGLVSISCSAIFHFFVAFCQISLATSAVWFFIPESPRWLIAQASRDKSSKNKES